MSIFHSHSPFPHSPFPILPFSKHPPLGCFFLRGKQKSLIKKSRGTHALHKISSKTLTSKRYRYLTFALIATTHYPGPISFSWFSSFREAANRPFPSSLVPLFQSESKCETILMKMSLICMKMKLHVELIFIRMVSHLDSLWNRGTRELGNGLYESQHVFTASRLPPGSLMGRKISENLWDQSNPTSGELRKNYSSIIQLPSLC